MAQTIIYGDFYRSRNGKAGFTGGPKGFLKKSDSNRRIAMNKAKEQLRLLAAERAEAQAEFEEACKEFEEFFTWWIEAVDNEEVV